MKRLLLAAALAASLVPAAYALPLADDQASQARIYRSVRHELVMLPQLTVFDNLAYKVDDGTVTLYGQVRNPVLKGEAARAVKKIEGVESVSNQIEVLPASFNDDRIRQREARAIYGYDGLFNYSLGTLPSIRIIVKNGNVTLEGVVDRQADKNIAGIRANGVPGVFSVTNHLQVEGSGSQN
jgi:hyperosmotically inducible protein